MEKDMDIEQILFHSIMTWFSTHLDQDLGSLLFDLYTQYCLFTILLLLSNISYLPSSTPENTYVASISIRKKIRKV